MDTFSINNPEAKISVHTIKVLNELAPHAVFVVDDNPFVLFFDRANGFDLKRMSKDIWNAQIPIAIVCDSDTVRVYDGRSIHMDNRTLLEAWSKVADGINDESPFSYWEVTSQSFWQTQVECFKGEELNERLLSDLKYITEKLQVEYAIPLLTATKLILRLIFIRYLIDRGVDIDYANFSSSPKESQHSLLDLLTNKHQLYTLFSHLKDKFNGNLFDLGDELDDDRLNDDVFRLLSDFFASNMDTQTKQLSFFDFYDFNIIPVELISNIYEILLGNESRRKDGAFYTPHYLVDYILDGTITPFIRENGCCKVLDPSCGSGIFLVESYRRMVERELGGQLSTTSNELLQSILSDNIFGVDLNGAAVDVAIFSLYLAVLDYKDPKTLKGRFELPNLRGSNLFECDFFNGAELKRLQNSSFDFIIGNPPWGKGTALQTSYVASQGYLNYMYSNDTCRAFLLRSKDFCSDRTHCCFILHSKLLYMKKKPSVLFREFLLTNTKLIRILELSSVRTLVFKNADAPAIVLSYQFSADNALNNQFEYISMKPNIFFRRFNIIVVEKNDIKHVPQALLRERDWAWKTLLYGFSGDIDTIIQLQTEFRSIKEELAATKPPLLKGTGVKYNDGDLLDATHLVGSDLLDSDAIDHFTIDLSKMSVFQKQKVDRPRNPKLFHAPYCLLLTGIEMSDYTMRSVFSETSFVFKEAIYAVKGNDSQKAMLQNLSALFNSKVYAYLNLMLGSLAGIEREKRLSKEVLGFPYVYTDDIASSVDIIQNRIAQCSSESATGLVDEVNQKIFEAFHLSNNDFVDYAIQVQIPLLTGRNSEKAYQPVTANDFLVYSRCFYEYFSHIFSDKHITVTVYPEAAKHYSAFELTIQDNAPDNWFRVVDEKDARLLFATSLSCHMINDMFYHLKDVLYFSEDSFVIIKPNFYKNWHPAIARTDLDEAIANAFFDEEGDAE
jgi:type I restriction-modification system DNA methylase subunit